MLETFVLCSSCELRRKFRPAGLVNFGTTGIATIQSISNSLYRSLRPSVVVEILRSHPLVLLIRSLPHCLSSDQERHSAINQWQSSKALTRSSFVNPRSSQARSCLFVCGFSFGSLRLPTPAPSYAVISQPSWECWLYLR